MKTSPEAMPVKPCGIGGGGHSPPYDWIPAPRFHEDKLRGNDPPEADREFEGVRQNPLGIPPLAKWE